MQKRTRQESKEADLGDFQIPKASFEDLAAIFKEFKTKSFQGFNEHQRGERVNRLLLDLIQKAKTPCFLLPAVLDYIDRVCALKVVESYSFSHFELYLNQFAQLSGEENRLVRGKITGKWVPRDEYQILFPIGMGKVYPGSHFVTAHGSPDLDTTVASFWGWMDAFSARVGSGLHLWNVPGGPPISQTEIQLLFNQIFGKGIFQHLAKMRTTLGLSGLDLMTQQGMVCKKPHESLLSIDHNQKSQSAVILVDEEGFYLGDWRSFDVEGVRQIMSLFNSCMRWFAAHVHLRLISLFSKERVSAKDLPGFIGSLFRMRIEESDVAREFSAKQKVYLDNYLKKVLGVKKGIEGAFEDLAHGLKGLSLIEWQECLETLSSLHKLPIFDRSGMLVEDRPRLFSALEKIFATLDKAIQSLRAYAERLEVALKIKTRVFEYLPHSVSARSEVEEIRSQMDNYTYLTVTMTDEGGKLLPLGIIHASDVHKNTLGTVTMRDFCNRDETKVPSYFEVISVIDHHKSHLQTSSAPMVLISDAQSSNVLCAELAFKINDSFSTGGMSHSEIEQQLKYTSKELSGSSSKRVLLRVLQRLLASEARGHFFVDPMREYIEYMHFLFAILDDTDLLTKVSTRDLECVVEILNRMKSLSVGKEVEIISLSDLPRDEKFIAQAARRILQHRDMYSLYRKIYLAREESVDQNILLCVKKQPSSFFIDTKEQNGCVRVGQAKLFKRNQPALAKHAATLRQIWYEDASAFQRNRPEVDLYLQMISTVASAEDLYAGVEGKYTHRDELWLWIPFTEQSIEHLKSFLNAFQSCPQVVQNTCSAEFYGPKAKEYEHIFAESFLPMSKAQVIADKQSAPLAILKYTAGTLNSRKAMITPYLPHLVE